MKTEYIKLNENFADDELYTAVNAIKSGGLVAFPTETVYGLGADATNPSAAKKIYEAKGRPSDNPLIIHISDPADAEKYTYTNSIYYKLAEKFMPGPLTVVLPARESIPKETRGGLDTVAVRCPSNLIAARLIALSGVPIAAPSANLSGSPSPTAARHVIEDMGGRIDVIIDGGDCDIGLESTIVSCSSNGALTLLRPGKITLYDLYTITENITIADAVTGALKQDERVLSPGMKYKHYAPSTPLILLDACASRAYDYIIKENVKKKAVICYDEDCSIFSGSENLHIFKFGSITDIEAQAHKLFTMLRDIDALGYDKIYAPLPDKDGMGLALYNRMIRAAAYKIIKL